MKRSYRDLRLVAGRFLFCLRVTGRSAIPSRGKTSFLKTTKTAHPQPAPRSAPADDIEGIVNPRYTREYPTRRARGTITHNDQRGKKKDKNVIAAVILVA